MEVLIRYAKRMRLGSLAALMALTPPAAKGVLRDLNTASRDALTALPGSEDAYAKKSVENRPDKRKDERVEKILPQATYDKINDWIIAKQAGAAKATQP